MASSMLLSREMRSLSILRCCKSLTLSIGALALKDFSRNECT